MAVARPSLGERYENAEPWLVESTTSSCLYVVRQSDYVIHPWSVTNGADLPVFVDPGNPNDVMVDWFTLST